jgi:hypothetical protein
MKMKAIVNLSVIFSLIIFSSLTEPIYAQKAQSKYSCLVSNGVPRTIVDTKRGKIELIIWKSNFFGSKWSPESRCQEVSKRFQRFADEGNLRYVTTGKMNGTNVICVGDKRVSGYECRKDGLLITLQPQDNPMTVMNELFDINNRIRGGGIQRGGAIDLVRFLENAPILDSSQVTEPSSPAPQQSPPLSVPSPNPLNGVEVPDLLQ